MPLKPPLSVTEQRGSMASPRKGSERTRHSETMGRSLRRWAAKRATPSGLADGDLAMKPSREIVQRDSECLGAATLLASF